MKKFWFALVALVLGVAPTLIPVTWLATPAQAVTVAPITQTYNDIVNGDFLSLGNGVLQCDPNRPQLSGTGSCAGFHQGVNAPQNFNDRSWMGNVDVDSNTATFNSSRANVTIPAGAQVVYARLYWSGNTGVVQGFQDLRCGSNTVPQGQGYQRPAGAPNTTTPLLSVGGASPVAVPVAAYASESAAQLGANQPQYYSASNEVTSAFAGVATGAAVPITVGNVWAPRGYGCYGGWSLTLVYDFGEYDPAVPSSAASEVLIYDGHVRKQAADATAEVVTFSGFRAAGPGARASFTLYEGDRSILGDTARYTSTTNPVPVEITNVFGELGNIGVGSAVGQVPFPNLSGTFVNGSVDVRQTNLTGVTAGATQVNLSLDTAGDSFLLQNAAFSVPTPSVRIDKSVDGTADEQTPLRGENATFTITVSNAGSTPLSNVRVVDPQAPDCARTIPTLPAPPNSGSRFTYTCSGPPTQNGYLNTASVRGTPPSGDDLDRSDTSQVQLADLQVAKSASPQTVVTSEETTFTVTVTNTGTVQLDDIFVDDPALPGCSATGLTLAPGASTTLECSVPVQGTFRNEVSATGVAATDPDVRPTATASAQADSASVRLDKASTGVVTDVDGDGVDSAGDTIDYTFVITNGGSVPLTGVVVSDPVVGEVTCPSTIAPGASVACDPVVYAVTQAQVDAGEVLNTATVEASGNGVVVSAEDSVTVPLASTLAVDLLKTSGQVRDADGDPVPPGEADAGDLIDYSFTVTNIGSSTITSYTVTDPMLGGELSCAPASLAPGESATCGPVPYELTQADVDGVVVVNDADVVVTDAAGRQAQDTETVPVDLGTESGSLSISKTIDGITDVDGNGLDVGDEVAYSFSVRNTGHTTLTLLTVTDPMVEEVTCEQTTLAPGDVVACQAPPHQITQEEIDAGAISNTALGQAIDPQGDPVTNTSTQELGLTPTASASLEKAVGAIPADPQAGQAVPISFTVTNTGAVTLLDPVVTDLDLGLDVSCSPTTLAPGEIAACGPVDHLLTQADIDAGRVVDSAELEATTPGGATVTDDATAVTEIVRNAALLSSKSAGAIVDANDSGVVDAGDTVDFTVSIQNVGGTTLSNLTVDDPLLGGALACEPTTIPRGGTATCGPVTYELTQDDLDAGQVRNVATVQATDPGGATLEEQPEVVVPIERLREIEVVKTAGDIVDSNETGRVDAGDTLDYSFTVTNTGTVTLTAAALADPLVGGEVECPGLTEPLAPGESRDCGPITYALTQGDVDAGEVSNAVTVSAVGPGGVPVEGDDSITTEIPQTASLTLEKSGAFLGGSPASAGDQIEYTFTVVNDGTLTLTLDEIEDPLLDEGISCVPSQLAPGGQAQCGPAVYDVTQADIDAGGVTNEASVTGTSAGGVSAADSDEAVVTLEGLSAISLEKSAGEIVDANDTGRVDAGDTITYTFLVRNTGTASVEDLLVDDPLLGGAVECEDTSLAPDGETECSGTYTLTLDDITPGQVVNEATASAQGAGQAPDPEPVTDEATVTIPGTNGILLEKTASEVRDAGGDPVPPGEAAAGDVIVYDFRVTNTGTTRITDVQVSDALLPDAELTCEPTTLDPGAVADCGSATYVLTQDDIDEGLVVNDATASAVVDAPGGQELSDAAAVPRSFDGRSALALTKMPGDVVDANGSGRLDAGDEIGYTFEVLNNGSRTESDVSVNDAMLSDTPISCDPSTLRPEETAICGPLTYVLTQEDLDAGQVVNVATANGTDPDGEPVESPEETATVQFTAVGEVDLVKSAGAVVDANGSGVVDAGDSVDYSFEVTNTGVLTLSDVSVSDPLLGDEAIVCDPAELAPGEVATCGPVTYVLTQADVDAGEVLNEATVSGSPPTGDPVTASDDLTVPIDASPAVELDKSAGEIVDANGSGRVDTGDTIDYSFVVTNTGATSWASVSVSDPLLSDEAIACAPQDVAPGETTDCGPVTYTLTQADVDAGQVVNEASASVVDVLGQEASGDDAITVAVVGPGSLGLEKTAGEIVDANDSGLVDAGDEVTYSFVVTNTGAVSVSAAQVSDVLQGEDDPALVCDVGPGGLAPGESAECEPFTYALTQADVDAGQVVNEATVTGEGPGGDPVQPGEDSVVVLVPRTAQLTVAKAAGEIVDANDSGRVDAGDEVDFTVTVSNAGAVTISDLVVQDPLLGEDPLVCAPTTLAPGEVAECEVVTYVLTQADIDAGQVVNVAVASGTRPGGEPVQDEGSVTVLVEPGPAVGLAKSAGEVVDANSSGRLDAGDEITYAFEVTNTGTTTLTSAVVTDAKVSDELIACDLGAGLAPGESVECDQVVYTVTQADVDAGVVLNEAVVDAVDAQGAPADGGDSAQVPLPTQPSIFLTKSAGAVLDANGSGVVDAGDSIDYSFEVTNTGVLTLSGVAVQDPLLGDEAIACDPAGLAPGEVATCGPVTYVLTQADVDAGEVVNEATASGTPPAGDPVTASDDLTVPIVAAPAVELDKTAGDIVDANANGVVGDAGDTVQFSLEATNSGATTLTELVVVDELLGGELPCAPVPLAPGATASCESEPYVITQDDVDGGGVTNSATVTGTDPQDRTVEDDDTVTVALAPAAAAIELDKGVGDIEDTNGSGAVDAGDEVDYSFLVTNTGGTTLRGIEVQDPLLGSGPITCESSDGLAPGATTFCGPVTYVLTQADIDAGEVLNTATVTGLDPQQQPVVDDDDAVLPVPQAPQLTTVKSAAEIIDANDSGELDAGDVVPFTVTVRNTGTVTVGELVVTDELLSADPIECGTDVLAPGGETDCGPVDYVLTQADLDAGQVTNVALAGGVWGPGDDPVQDEDEVVVPLDGPLGLDLLKEVAATEDTNGNGVVDAGDSLVYAFTVTNTGQSTLTTVEVRDPMLADEPFACAVPEGGLPPGGSVSCDEGRHVLTQEEVEAGSVANEATATGVDGQGREVSASDDVLVPVVGAAALDLVKNAGEIRDANGTGVLDAGDEIDYSFTVLNTGSVRLTGIDLQDPMLGGAVVCVPSDLEPGQRADCGPVTYTLSQTDVDRGEVVNTATVSAGSPMGPVTDDDATTTPVPGSDRVTIEKSASDLIDSNGSGTADAGDTIEYTFVVTNTGTRTVSDVEVSDPLLGGDVACSVASLAPGSSTACGPFVYVVTAQDVDRGEVVNTASVVAIPVTPGGGDPAPDPVIDDDTVTTPVDDLPRTGADLLPLLLTGALLLLGGGLLLRTSRAART